MILIRSSQIRKKTSHSNVNVDGNIIKWSNSSRVVKLSTRCTKQMHDVDLIMRPVIVCALVI